MKTIKQQAEVTYSAINFQEAIIVAPLMDELIRQINSQKTSAKYHSLPKEERDQYQWPSIRHVVDNAEKVFEVLTQLGFCGTGTIDILPEGNPLEKREQPTNGIGSFNKTAS